MRFTLRVLPPIAAAYALFVLAPLSAYAQEASTPETHGIVVANMDRSVKPGDDFYDYANGDWLKRTKIPPDRRYIDPNGFDFDDSNDLTRKRIASLIEEATKTNAPAGSNARKIADFYHSYMEEAAIEAKGLAPLRPHLDAIAAVHDKHDLARALGESLRADVDGLNDDFHTASLFGLWVAPGFNDPEHYAAYLLQGGLEMPDREYYLSDSASMRGLRTEYQLAGFTDPDARAQHVVKLEHAIAEKHISLADEKDIHKANNTWKQADFAANAPGLDWAEYFRVAGSAAKQASLSGSPQPSQGSPLSLPLPRWTRGTIGWPSTSLWS